MYREREGEIFINQLILKIPTLSFLMNNKPAQTLCALGILFSYVSFGKAPVIKTPRVIKIPHPNGGVPPLGGGPAHPNYPPIGMPS